MHLEIPDELLTDDNALASFLADHLARPEDDTPAVFAILNPVMSGRIRDIQDALATNHDVELTTHKIVNWILAGLSPAEFQRGFAVQLDLPADEPFAGTRTADERSLLDEDAAIESALDDPNIVC